MPLGIGLHVLIAICFAVHALRTGQDRYWLFILFAFPLLGSVVYAIAIWLPDMRHHRGVRQAVRGARRILDPGRELREAREELEHAATPNNRLRLAEALLEAGQATEAVAQYETVRSGIYANDPYITVRLAHALLEAGRPGEARQLLEKLITDRPDFKSPEGHLVYACAVAAIGDHAKAHEEFDVLVSYYAGLEARARYAEILLGWGERERATSLVTESLKLADRMPRHSREMNREWLVSLKRSEAQLAGK
jgi:hypothetical protein